MIGLMPISLMVVAEMLMLVMALASRIGRSRCDHGRRDCNGDQGACHDFSIQWLFAQTTHRICNRSC
jgi:hypothetical protein